MSDKSEWINLKTHQPHKSFPKENMTGYWLGPGWGINFKNPPTFEKLFSERLFMEIFIPLRAKRVGREQI